MADPSSNSASAASSTGLDWLTREGPLAAQDMLRTDLSLFERYPFRAEPAAETSCRAPETIGPVLPTLRVTDTLVTKGNPHVPELSEAVEFARNSAANQLVPADQRQVGQSDAVQEGTGLEFGQLSLASKDGGVSYSQQRGVREYLASGYTRRNPNGTETIDTDWGGKWKSLNLKAAEKTWLDESAAAYSDSFGDPAKSFLSGKYEIGAGTVSTRSALSITNGGVDLTPFSAKGSLYAGQISAEANKGGLLSGTGQASYMKASGEATSTVVLNPEEATARLKLAASANVVEVKGGGELCLTPMRVVNGYRSLQNWLFNGHDAMLSDDWDIGLCLGVEAQAAVGAQAEAGGELSYQKGKARAEIGAKIGAGIGLGANISVGATGVDHALELFK
ncbi:hypothetical protein [Rhodovulum sulfidophilum]|uniref:hypothetical protein n=1 Tax=Rhodovulum sulfidophilum TaxID=35806 RepID=UPI00138983BD|nr:hypothetical protein [Rhodovulum sulfidophilum]MBL3561862.1 hypothetical protein [Rhodovulum sulfidophilum]NDK36835.1 hypothetical protein [Rhodovulum sulfidophilum]